MYGIVSLFRVSFAVFPTSFFENCEFPRILEFFCANEYPSVDCYIALTIAQMNIIDKYCQEFAVDWKPLLLLGKLREFIGMDIESVILSRVRTHVRRLSAQIGIETKRLKKRELAGLDVSKSESEDFGWLLVQLRICLTAHWLLNDFVCSDQVITTDGNARTPMTWPVVCFSLLVLLKIYT